MSGNSPLFALCVRCNPELLPQHGLIARICRRAEARGLGRPYSETRLRHYLRAGLPGGAGVIDPLKCAELARAISGATVPCTGTEVARALAEALGIDLRPEAELPLFIAGFTRLSGRDQQVVATLVRAMLAAPSAGQPPG